VAIDLALKDGSPLQLTHAVDEQTRCPPELVGLVEEEVLSPRMARVPELQRRQVAGRNWGETRNHQRAGASSAGDQTLRIELGQVEHQRQKVHRGREQTVPHYVELLHSALHTETSVSWNNLHGLQKLNNIQP
jgi:hypothetical protein